MDVPGQRTGSFVDRRWRGLEARHALLFGDQTGWFYSLEAETGKLLWKKKIEAHDAARLTGAPVAYNGNVFVPIASWEETRSLDPALPLLHVPRQHCRASYSRRQAGLENATLCPRR